MRYSRTRFMQAVDLLGEVLSASEPAERSVEKFFRRNKQMGSKDRRSTSDIVYLCVRRKLELETLVKLSGVSAPSNIEASLALDCCDTLIGFQRISKILTLLLTSLR